jgi:hypothetical protein
MNTSSQRIFIRTLEIDFDELILFKDRYFRFVAIGSNHQLLAHSSPPSA